MKTVIELAREVYGVHTEWTGAPLERLTHFAELVRADEREACAKVCDVLAVHPEYASEVTKLAAVAIRNRSKA